MSAGEEEFALHCRAEKIAVTREFRFDLKRRWRFDFVILPKDLSAKPNLAVEIEGGVWMQGRHSRGKGMESDMEKYNRAAVLGWRILRFTPEMVKDGTAINTVLEALK